MDEKYISDLSAYSELCRTHNGEKYRQKIREYADEVMMVTIKRMLPNEKDRKIYFRRFLSSNKYKYHSLFEKIAKFFKKLFAKKEI